MALPDNFYSIFSWIKILWKYLATQKIQNICRNFGNFYGNIVLKIKEVGELVNDYNDDESQFTVLSQPIKVWGWKPN